MSKATAVRPMVEQKTINMPLSFQGFGPTAIIAMVLILSVAQGVQYLRSRHRHH
jgi:hypothetical protein